MSDEWRKIISFVNIICFQSDWNIQIKLNYMKIFLMSTIIISVTFTCTIENNKYSGTTVSILPHNLLKMLICLQKIENLVNKTKTINELSYQSIYTSSSFLQTSVSCLE
jgi:hypothetical protein